MIVRDLGRMPYCEAWTLQEQAHAQVLAGAEELLLLAEHPPVITFGRRPDAARNLVASQQQLAQLGVELVQSDRGGDITFHGPGQIVAYPIVRLLDRHLSAGAYVRRLEEVAIATLAQFGIHARLDPAAIGVWVPPADAAPSAERDAAAGVLAKICALGVRIRRGVSLHGIALNVTTDLSYFQLIVPCGLAGRAVTSMQAILRERTPDIHAVKEALVNQFQTVFGGAPDE